MKRPSFQPLAAAGAIAFYAAGTASFITPSASADIGAAVVPTAVIDNAQLSSGARTKRSKKRKGHFEVVQRGGQTFICLSDNFRAAKGPDLKVFLSPTAFNDVTGGTAINGAISLGVLKSVKGSQEYPCPSRHRCE
jgi:hypothetical protein